LDRKAIASTATPALPTQRFHRLDDCSKLARSTMSRGRKSEESKEQRHRGRPLRPRRTHSPTNIPAIPPWAHATAVITTVALAVGVYRGCLHGAFVFDDLNAVAQSLLIRSITPIGRFLTNSTRPLVDFGFAINHALGGLDTWWFHFTNVAFHALNCILVYFLAIVTMTLPAVAERYAERRQPIAWATAALFAVHPLASETVAYISSRSEVQVAFFFLLTLLSYAISQTTGDRRVRRFALIAIPLFTAAALGSKEIAITLPLALLLYDWVFLAGGDWQKVRVRYALGLPLIPLLAGLLFLLVLRPGALFAPYSQTAGFNFDRYTRSQYLITQFGVTLHYLSLAIFPSQLNFDYDWPLTKTFSPQVLLNFLVLAALSTGAFLLRRAQPLLSFAVLFTFVILAPTSSFIPLADLAVERRMYLPLVALALLAAGSVADATRWAAATIGEVPAALRSLAFAVVVAVPLVLFAALTHTRANLWGDDLALHLDAVEKSPNSPRVRLNLGVIYLNTQHVAEAHRELFEAKRLYDLGESIHAFPRIGAFIHYNLGAVLYVEKDYELADEQLRRALELGGNFVALRPMAYLIRAHIARNRGDWEHTEAFLTEAVKYNRDHADWFITLAEAKLKQGKLEEARTTLRRVEQLHPGAKDLDYAKAIDQEIRAATRARARARQQADS
jgi:tetratricopeptide (TPR) repeat protein